MRALASFFVIITIAGCAGGQWVHPTNTVQEFQRDKMDCENIIVTKSGGWAHVEPFTASYEIRQCLESRGYQLASK